MKTLIFCSDLKMLSDPMYQKSFAKVSKREKGSGKRSLAQDVVSPEPVGGF